MEQNEIKNDQGMIDLTDRLLKELLRTPKVKAGLKLFLESLDPEAAPRLVKTLMWEDSEIFLSSVGSLPEMINALILCTGEMARQVQNFPPELMATFMAHAVDKLDGEALGEAIGELSGFACKLHQVDGNPLHEAALTFGRSVSQGIKNVTVDGETEDGHDAQIDQTPIVAALKPFIGTGVKAMAEASRNEDSGLAKTVNGLVRELASALRDNPDFTAFLVFHVLKPFVEVFQASAVIKTDEGKEVGGATKGLNDEGEVKSDNE